MKLCLALSETVLVYIFLSSGIINIILHETDQNHSLVSFHTSLFLTKIRCVRGDLLLGGESTLRCLQGQTGALANTVCHRIISTVNFRLGHRLASSQTRSAWGGWLGGASHKRQTFHAAYPITFPGQRTSCLLSNCASHCNLGLFLRTQSSPPACGETPEPVPNHRLQSNNNMAVVFM